MSVSTDIIGRRFERFVEQHARFPMSQSAHPGSAADALAPVAAGLSLLTGLDAAELTAAEQADCLRALERAHAPVAQDGPTSLENCCLVCLFHHQIAIHKWGWQLHLNPDGTTTAQLDDRTLHSHALPAA
jgi:hypothetical protein